MNGQVSCERTKAKSSQKWEEVNVPDADKTRFEADEVDPANVKKRMAY
jgi:hypothetical protein